MSSLTSLSSGETNQEEPELGVLITGGKDSFSSPLASAEFFGSATCYVPPLPEPRSGHVSFVKPNGTIAVCGGWAGGDGRENNSTSEAPTPQLGGVVTSPNYPENYTSGIDKTFIIEGSPGKILQMTIVDLDIEVYDYDYGSYDEVSGTYEYDYDNPICDYDWLQVRA